jgi:hypothetical protein
MVVIDQVNEYPGGGIRFGHRAELKLLLANFVGDFLQMMIPDFESLQYRFDLLHQSTFTFRLLPYINLTLL